MMTRERFNEQMEMILGGADGLYDPADVPFMKELVYTEGQMSLLYVYMLTKQDENVREGRLEDDPINIPVNTWQAYFPEWKVKCLDTDRQWFVFSNPVEIPI